MSSDVQTMRDTGESELENQMNQEGETRRTLLKSGFLGALIFPLAFSLRTMAAETITEKSGVKDGQGLAAGDFRAFTAPHHRLILRVIVQERLSGVLPEGASEQEGALDKVLIGCDQYMAHMPLPVQDEAREGLDLLDIAPVRWLLGGPWGDWESADRNDVQGFLDDLRTSRFALKRTLYQFLHDMGHVGWFGDRASWSALGYPGPPDVPRPKENRSDGEKR